MEYFRLWTTVAIIKRRAVRSQATALIATLHHVQVRAKVRFLAAPSAPLFANDFLHPPNYRSCSMSKPYG